MIITFLGHSDFQSNEQLEHAMLKILNAEIVDREVELYLGCYGNFDTFASVCVQKLKKKNQPLKLIWITPYVSEQYLKNKQTTQILYDAIIYPPLENAPYKFAISHRNRWMIDCADLVVAYVNRTTGGAYQAIEYARKKGKRIINLAAE